MASTIGNHQQSAFIDPQNGQSPVDADQVRANDEALRAAYNAHDNDGGIHIQTSALADRPAAGSAGRIWVTTDTKQLFIDTGAAWAELDYIAASGATMTGDLVVPGIQVSADADVAGTVLAAAILVSGAGAATIIQIVNTAGSGCDWRFQALDTGAFRLIDQTGSTVAWTVGTDGRTTIAALTVNGTSTLTGAVTASSTINGQTIGSSSSFTDDVAVAGDLTVGGIGVVTVNAIGNTGAAKTVDWSASNTATITANQSTTLTFSGAVTGQWCALRIAWGGTYTITWPSSVVWPGGTAPTFTRISGRVDWVSFYFNGTKYEAFPSSFNLAP